MKAIRLLLMPEVSPTSAPASLKMGPIAEEGLPQDWLDFFYPSDCFQTVAEKLQAKNDGVQLSAETVRTYRDIFSALTVKGKR
ncbi:MAG: hypothetical protein LBP22_09755 [Deltaproteobacteria bacterium]|jgi:hypothetical protein|nr:hypothetical protein [Deltaproteobacteria bacterium]